MCSWCIDCTDTQDLEYWAGTTTIRENDKIIIRRKQMEKKKRKESKKKIKRKQFNLKRFICNFW